MTYLFKRIDYLAYQGDKVILTDGTANQEYGTAKIALGYYDMADNTWKDKEGAALDFIPYYWFPVPVVLA